MEALPFNLKPKYFKQLKSGQKKFEFRKASTKYNCESLAKGREAIFIDESGQNEPISGRIKSYEFVRVDSLLFSQREAVKDYYGNIEYVFKIEVELC